MVTHVRLREWQRVGPEDEGGAELRGRHLVGEPERRLAVLLDKAGVLSVKDLYGGIEVRAFAHVGRVQFGDLVVTVEPKFESQDLLALVRYAYGLRDLKLFETTGIGIWHHGLQDLLIAQLVCEARELVDRGLARRYVHVTEPLASPRGRIDMNRLAMANGEVLGELTCTHHPRSSDHLLNAVLHGGLKLAASLAQDTHLKFAASRLGAVLQEFASPARLEPSVFAKVRRNMNRLVAAYKAALQLIELLYYGRAVSLDDGAIVPLPGFLFDMNRFFQALLARFLTEHLPAHDVMTERALTDMMRYLPTHNPGGRKPPLPRPDFTVCGPGKSRMLLDAKYRDLWDSPLPRDMLYQLAVYALSQPKGSTAAILYPTTTQGAREAVVEIREPVMGGVRAFVAIRPVVIAELLSAVREPTAGPGERLAMRLAFGTSEAMVDAHR